MNRKWIIALAAFALAGLLMFFLVPSRAGKTPLVVKVLTIATDAAGRRLVQFSATNGTERLFVRGRSEIEVQAIPSNQVTVVQITNVDYLKPHQTIAFSMPFPETNQPWRLKFTYMGQFDRLESFKYEVGWGLHRRGLPFPVNSLPRHEVREVTTDWITN